MDSPGCKRTKRCPACGTEFTCCAGGCWCDEVSLSQDALQRLQQTHADCLCPACLHRVAAESLSRSAQHPTPDGVPMKTPVVMSWSGGKDCATALHELLKTNQYGVVALLTTISEEYKRISHHGVRESLLDAQAAAIGIPLAKVYLPANNSHPCTNA